MFKTNQNKVEQYGENFRRKTSQISNDGLRNPRTLIQFSIGGSLKDHFHPTQKPVALFEYLIKTYTKEGDIVLDNVAGSGTTAIAAMNTNRKWICIERDQEYYTKAIERIKQNDNI